MQKINANRVQEKTLDLVESTENDELASKSIQLRIEYLKKSRENEIEIELEIDSNLDNLEIIPIYESIYISPEDSAENFNKIFDQLLKDSGGAGSIKSIKENQGPYRQSYQEITMSNGDLIRINDTKTAMNVNYADSKKQNLSYKFTDSSKERNLLINNHVDSILLIEG